MSTVRILHVDDEPDIREVVEMSLTLDPDLAVRSCASGADALAAAAEWTPFIILLDVMMPVMDGPATLAKLRQNAVTADIPVLFMTARAQAREVEHFISLGARGVIPKPFDPMTLATLVRRHLRDAGIGAMRGIFVRRACNDAVTLAALRAELSQDAAKTVALVRLRETAHGLAGAAGVFGLPELGCEAAALEAAVAERLDGVQKASAVERALDVLLLAIGNTCAGPRRHDA